PPCGRVRTSMSTEGVLLEGGSAAIAELARVLAIPLGRSVVDRTALAGAYDIRLQFSKDNYSTDSGIFTAIQEQLGLKLAAANAPVGVLVIDHIERPAPN